MNFKFNEEMLDCPRCGSDDISRDAIDVQLFHCEVECQSCGYAWFENFVFVNNEKIQDDD